VDVQATSGYRLASLAGILAGGTFRPPDGFSVRKVFFHGPERNVYEHGIDG
jgi:hypothetical protein